MADLLVRVPGPIDLTPERVEIGDTTAFLSKFTATQVKLEVFSQGLTHLSDDLQAVADAVAENAEQTGLDRQQVALDRGLVADDRNQVAIDRVAVLDAESSASRSAQRALDAAQIAESAAHLKGDWDSLTGLLEFPATVRHEGRLWALASEDLPDVELHPPSESDGRWVSVLNIVRQPVCLEPVDAVDVAVSPVLSGSAYGNYWGLARAHRTFVVRNYADKAEAQVVSVNADCVVKRALTLLNQDAVLAKRTINIFVEVHRKQTFRRTHRVGAVDNDNIQRARLSVSNPLDTVFPKKVSTGIIIGFTKFREVLFTIARNRLIDINLPCAFYVWMLQHFF